MSTNKDRAEAQARSFRAAAIGSVMSDDTLGVTMPIQQDAEGTVLRGDGERKAGFWNVGFGGLRDYLRRRRAKRRAKYVKRLLRALDLDVITATQLEISRKLSEIERQMDVRTEIQGMKLDKLINRHSIYLVDNRVAIRTPYGYVICPQTEHHMIIYLSEVGLHEPGTCRVIESIIDSGDRVVDVGAQVGLLTLVMGRAVGPSGHVLALEASEVLADCIRQTLLANGLLESSSVVQMAVSDKTGTAIFHLADRSSLSSLFPLSVGSREIEVQTAPLDDLTSTGDRISLVKVDVEGAELLVLQGMSRLIRDNPEIVLLVEFGPSHLARVGQTIDQWLSAFRDCGFDRIFEIDEEAAVCRPLRSETQLSKVQSLNLVFARSGSSRIARIPLS